jgi:arginyl-tRNA synthetase
MDIKFRVATLVVDAIKKTFPETAIEIGNLATLLESPKDPTHGDLALPCFTLAKSLRRPPPALAGELAGAVATTSLIARVNPVGPYLNFFLNKAMLAHELLPTILGGTYLAPRTSKSDRVMVEYSQPNTHKAFHVGHVRNASLGDSLTRLFEWCGHTTIPVNYIGDEGAHVAKCLWLYRRSKETPPAHHRGEFLGRFYSQAVTLLDLGSLTTKPFPGVIAARVGTVDVHPKEAKWSVLRLDIPGNTVTVVTAGQGAAPNDIVPYVPVGVEFNGKIVGQVDKGGVISTGMVLSELEYAESADNLKLAQLPPTTPLGTSVVELGRIAGAVPEGRSVLAELNQREQEVSAILQGLEKPDPEIHALWKETKQWSMEEYHEVYRWLNCRFDHYFYESEFGEAGKEIARDFQKRGLLIDSAGAVGADLTTYGLGFCILIKRDGTANYATRDLALARKKFEQYKIDRSIYVVDDQQTHHFKQVFKVLELAGYAQVQKCFHLAYAQVVLPSGKMSSRKGSVIYFSELQERLLNRINSEFLDKYKGEWPAEEIATAAHRIALATMRYGMLNQAADTKIVFDLEAWTNKSGNTGPYMMYAYARIRSIMRELGALDPTTANYDLLTHETEQAVILELTRYHEVVEQSLTAYSPHILAGYTYELAKAFSRMYQHCSVVNAETPDLKLARASLVESVGRVLKHGLSLLGIETIERM